MGECVLSADGAGPVAGHCRECDLLIVSASKPHPMPGRAFVIHIDAREINAYQFGRSIDYVDYAA
jgi:hypothetical protein